MNDSTEKPDPLPRTEKIPPPAIPAVTVLDRSRPGRRAIALRRPAAPSAITRSSARSAAAAWASSTGSGRRASTASSPSRCCCPGRWPAAADLRALQDRGRGDRRPAPSQHRHRPRGRRERRLPLLQHGLHRRRQPGRSGWRRGRCPAGWPPATSRPSPAPSHHAHQHGILHRDLKPSNILIDAERRAARHRLRPGQAAARRHAADAHRRRPRHAELHGPRAGRRPHQGPGRRPPTCTASGAILYECLTGRPPFQAETPVDTMMQVLERDPAPPSLLNPNVDRDLETICLKCLEKDPANRYAERRGAGRRPAPLPRRRVDQRQHRQRLRVPGADAGPQPVHGRVPHLGQHAAAVRGHHRRRARRHLLR